MSFLNTIHLVLEENNLSERCMGTELGHTHQLKIWSTKIYQHSSYNKNKLTLIVEKTEIFGIGL